MIRNISIKNICVIDDFDMDFSAIKVAMVVGESGSGKTTLLGSVFACLYGSFPDKPERTLYEDVKNQDLPGEIELILDIEQKQFRVKRVVEAKDKKNYAYVYEGQTLVAGPQIKGFEAWINDNIMDRNMFLSLHYLSQKRKNDICGLSPSISSAVVMDLLGLSKFQEQSKKFQKISEEANSSLVFIENQFAQIRDAKTRIVSITAKKEELTGWLGKASAELENLEGFINAVDTGRLSKEISEKENKITDTKREIINLTNKNALIRKQREMMSDQLDLVKKAGCKKGSNYEYPKCPLLNVEKLLNKDKILLSEIESNSKVISALEQKAKSLDIELEEIIDKDKEGTHAKRLLSIEEKKNLVQETSLKNRELGAIENEISNLEAIISKSSVLKQQKEEYKIKALYSDFIYRAFGKKGAPSLIMEDAFNEINKIANDICVEHYVPFRFAISFVKDDGNESVLGPLNIMLVDETGRSRHVSSYSGGEFQLAQIILRFAVQNYLSNVLNRDKIGILIMDEPWSEQDSNLAEITYRIINDNSRFGQILIISHDTSFCSKFDNVIEVSKGETTTVKLINL
jgi:DNA repair exonuclease SbcCD ATPase subunit